MTDIVKQVKDAAELQAKAMNEAIPVDERVAPWTELCGMLERSLPLAEIADEVERGEQLRQLIIEYVEALDGGYDVLASHAMDKIKAALTKEPA